MTHGCSPSFAHYLAKAQQFFRTLYYNIKDPFLAQLFVLSLLDSVFLFLKTDANKQMKTSIYILNPLLVNCTLEVFYDLQDPSEARFLEGKLIIGNIVESLNVHVMYAGLNKTDDFFPD